MKLWITLTDIAHVLGGILAALLTPQYPVLSTLIVVVFLLYQFDESWHINDEAFADIKEFLYGLVIGASYFILKPWLIGL